MFLVILTLAFAILLKPVWDGIRLNASGIRVNGRVESVETYRVKNGQRCRIEYTFATPDGMRFGTDDEIRLSEAHGLSKGSLVPITYLPSASSVSSLGVPGKLWGARGGDRFPLMMLGLLGLVTYAAVAWQAWNAAKDRTQEVSLRQRGQVVEGEAISMDVSGPHRGRVTTTVTYRVPLESGSAIGTAKYHTAEHRIRRTRAGEKIPLLVIDEDHHRPL